MHSPRGSNDRNCERNVNRNNGNRLFDSQNNAKGGYACPRAVGGPNGPTEQEQEKVYYYEGEKVFLEWTNQHGSGDNGKLHTDVIWQYACSDTLDPTGKFASATAVGAPRDGIPRDGNDAATDRIPDNANNAAADNVENRRFGMHESYDYYQECQRTERNKGLYTADQNLNRRDARGTRQNPNGNRNGLECPEERDYYPYWRPSPWKDVAVFTSEWSTTKEKYYRDHANQVMARGYCTPVDQQDFDQKRQQRQWYNNEAACVAAGHTWTGKMYAINYDPTGKTQPPPPIIAQGAKSRVNQLGNAMPSYVADGPLAVDTMWEICSGTNERAPTKGRNKCPAGSPGTGTFMDENGRIYDDNYGTKLNANSYGWTVPYGQNNENCVLRLRYNISTWDFPGWKNGNRYLQSSLATAGDIYTDNFAGGVRTDANGAKIPLGTPGVNASFNCQDNNQEGKICSTVSPVTQDPYVKVFEGAGGNTILSLALNTNQYARTFQDRTYVFAIRQRPADVPTTTRIISLGVRGKRGNIVQTYPAVEYDFAPSYLTLDAGSKVHVQWAGSDYNPQRGCNNGEGGPPDCQGCTNLQQAINAGNANSRADRTNLVFMDNAGNNFPAGARGLAKDLYSAVQTDAMTPFAEADAAKTLAYIGQEASLQKQFGADLGCLSQTELEAINNKNRRENHPQNCAKLNGARTPYFDGKLMTVKEAGSAQKGKTYAAQSTRNNNFSNRDQTMEMCVRSSTDTAKATCNNELASTGQINAHFNPYSAAAAIAPIDGVPLPPGQQAPEPTPIDSETTNTIEKDNDAVGDGEKDACEARISDFLASIGIWGLIAIACAFLILGVIGTLIVQAIIRRFQNKKKWMAQDGTKV